MPAFTSLSALELFARLPEQRTGGEMPYATVRGWRLLEHAVPGLGYPVGIAVDVGAEQPMLIPPNPPNPLAWGGRA